MKVILRLAFFAGTLLAATVLTVAYAEGDVCVYKPPKVRRVCGKIVDSFGRPIPTVRVTVLKDGTDIKNDATDENGEFDFDAQPGKYELDARTPGFQPAHYQLTLSKPTKSWQLSLLIEMEAGGIHCGADIRKTKNPLARKH